jgi:hypothetical protein
MAYTGKFCTEAEIAAMAGELVDATGATEANRNLWASQVESFLNCFCRHNFSDTFAALNADVKAMLSEYAARYVACCETAYNMAGFTSRIEAEDMLNIHFFRMNKIEELLNKQVTIDFIEAA